MMAPLVMAGTLPWLRVEVLVMLLGEPRGAHDPARQRLRGCKTLILRTRMVRHGILLGHVMVVVVNADCGSGWWAVDDGRVAALYGMDGICYF